MSWSNAPRIAVLLPLPGTVTLPEKSPFVRLMLMVRLFELWLMTVLVLVSLTLLVKVVLRFPPAKTTTPLVTLMERVRASPGAV